MRRRYTKEEEQIIAQEISLHPTNISRGINSAAEKLGRSPQSVRNHWYMVVSKKQPVFCVLSSNIAVRNRKGHTTKTENVVVRGMFKKFINWLFNKNGKNRKQ